MLAAPWLSVFLAYYMAVRTPSFYADCPRWLVLTIRVSAALYGAFVALGQIFILRDSETGQLASALLALVSILVSAIALIYARNMGRGWRGPNG